jgi:hypothetical protein
MQDRRAGIDPIRTVRLAAPYVCCSAEADTGLKTTRDRCASKTGHWTALRARHGGARARCHACETRTAGLAAGSTAIGEIPVSYHRPRRQFPGGPPLNPTGRQLW